MWKILNAVACAILILFALVQYNDPDALYWIIVYLAAALWPALVIAKPELLVPGSVWRMAGWAGIAACIAGFVVNADMLGSNWIHVEAAREGIGYLFAAAGIGLALYTSRGGAETSLA